MTALPCSCLKFAMSLVDLGIDTQQVIALRLMKLSRGGPEAVREAARMVSEKLSAYADSHKLMMLGVARGEADLAVERVVHLYQTRVSANKRRLVRG